MRPFGLGWWALPVAALIALSCAGRASDRAEPLVVSAAASLTEAMREIEPMFEAAQPGVDLRLNLGGSFSLREQILSGAPVDVFVSADRANMERIANAGLLDSPARVLARNRLQIAVPAGNHAGVTGLADFGRPELLIGLCAVQVPCGSLAARALASAGIDAEPDTLEPSVRALLTKIAAGELDAGLVYASDVLSTRHVEGLEIAQYEVATEYPVAVLARARDLDSATLFVELLFSHQGQATLEEHGFAVHE